MFYSQYWLQYVSTYDFSQNQLIIVHYANMQYAPKNLKSFCYLVLSDRPMLIAKKLHRIMHLRFIISFCFIIN